MLLVNDQDSDIVSRKGIKKTDKNGSAQVKVVRKGVKKKLKTKSAQANWVNNISMYSGVSDKMQTLWPLFQYDNFFFFFF